jgi:hypothetical protein
MYEASVCSMQTVLSAMTSNPTQHAMAWMSGPKRSTCQRSVSKVMALGSAVGC